MKKDVDVQRKVLRINGGVEYWLEKDEAEKLQSVLQAENLPKFIEVRGDIISTYKIDGIFSPPVIEEAIRRSNGQWKDKGGKWHDKFEAPCPGCGNVIPKGKKCGYC